MTLFNLYDGIAGDQLRTEFAEAELDTLSTEQLGRLTALKDAQIEASALEEQILAISTRAIEAAKRADLLLIGKNKAFPRPTILDEMKRMGMWHG